MAVVLVAAQEAPGGGERAPHPSRVAEVKEASRLGSSGLKKVTSRTQRLQGREQEAWRQASAHKVLPTVQCFQSVAT